MKFYSTLSFLGAAATAYAAPAAEPDTASLNTCPTSKFDYDYIVVGSGAGGGPVAARLALAGYSVGLVEHGRDVVNVNTTIPLYLGRSNEDDQIALDYDVKLYNTPQYTPQVHNWYPRASGLGGSTIHNALVSVYQVDDDLNTISKQLGDPSWNGTNMRNYFKKLEKNIYLPKEVGEPAGHGYDGWLYMDAGPSNLLTDPQYYDPQLIDVATGLQSMMPTMPLGDFNTLGADGVMGGGGIVLTKNPAHNRSSVRDFLADTQATRSNLHILYETMATKVLLCNSGGVKAYGVQVATGANLLPVARLFKGKQRNLSTKTLTAKYEVIVSAGVYQTPQLLKLSGIGPTMELASNGIVPRVNLPGVGENLIDRLEISVVWKLNQAHKLFSGCKFGDDPKSDPCLQSWIDSGHTNLYSSGPGFWATGYKTDPNLPYLDIWQTWAPAIFRGYLRGYPTEIANTPDVISSIVLKGHTQSRGFVRLTGNHPQDKLDINKNLFATAAGKKDLTDLVEAVKQTRAMVANQTLITSHIKEEYWPGAKVKTDADIAKWIQNDAWGHHACCTAKIGTDKDPMAVLNKDFQVRGVKNLRVVDLSAFPEIPGLFVTTPTYMISEKAADVILQLAAKNGWKPSNK